jgi:two-component system, OmpR family, sensor kinase
VNIRTRLALSATIVLAVTIAVLGVALVRTARSAMVEQIDNGLRDYADRVDKYPQKPGGGDSRNQFPGGYGGYNARYGTPESQNPSSADADENDQSIGPPEFHQYAEFAFDFEGNEYEDEQVLAGYPGEGKSPPDLPPLPSEEADDCLGEIVTFPSVDGSLDYRVLIRETNFGYRVTAAPLSTVDETVAQLQRWVMVAGGVALAVAALVTWWLIRQGMRPVDRMVDTAAAIAAGDLTRRVPIQERRSELGRLGLALNEMLHQIERGIRHREASEERLRRFVADAAHELRTPLTALRGYTELYRQGGLPDKEAVDNAMGRIEGESARLTRLVEDMLLLARLDNERELEMEPIDVVDVVQEAIAAFQAIAPDRPLTANLTEEAPVVADRVRLRQVIDNLLVNTRVHTPPGTPVEIAVRPNSKTVDIIVSDQGPGISAADQAKVFERFWRADPSRVRRTGGTGLGLAIVSSLVQAHGGTIELLSEPGRGARFTVRLPLAPPLATATV